MRFFKGVPALAATLAAISFAMPAIAATVNSTGGQVLINRGNGYQQVAGTTEGNPGDTVVVNPGGSGTIVYPNGCVVNVSPGTVVTIAAEPPCATGTGAGPTGATFAIGAVVVGAGVGAALFLSQKDKAASP